MCTPVIPFDPVRSEPAAPIIDVLLPVHNAAPTIETSVLSVLAQTVTDIRVIAVDDGSTDTTASLLSEIARDDARLVVVRKHNGGIVDALNLALSMSNATYVARQDGDDISFPDRFARQLAVFSRCSGTVAVSGSCFHIDMDDRRLGTTYNVCLPDDANFDAIPSIEPYLLHPFLMARRVALNAVGGYRHAFHAEDTDLYWRLRHIGRLVNIDQPLGLMRLHPGSITNASVVNGRVSAIHSQLAAISARRQAAGREDIRFPRDRLAALTRARSFEAMIGIVAADLDRDEAGYLCDAASVKLLELANSRAFELESEDLRYIGDRYRSLPAARLRGPAMANWAYRATLARLLRSRQIGMLAAFADLSTLGRTAVLRLL